MIFYYCTQPASISISNNDQKLYGIKKDYLSLSEAKADCTNLKELIATDANIDKVTIEINIKVDLEISNSPNLIAI